jgi:hypothetical protein
VLRLSVVGNARDEVEVAGRDGLRINEGANGYRSQKEGRSEKLAEEEGFDFP